MINKVWSEIKELPNIAWILVLLNALLGIAQFVVTPYLSLFLYNERQLSAFQTGLILGISPLIATMLSPINGVLTKKWGYRNSLIIGSSGWIIASILYANARHLSLFLLATTITGLTGGIENIAFMTILSVTTPDKLQNQLFNLNYWILNWTACIGPLMGTFMGGGKNPYLFYLVTVAEIISTTIIVIVTKSYHQLDKPNNQKSTKNNYEFFEIKILKNTNFLFVIIGALVFLIGYSQIDSNFSLFLSQEYVHGDVLYGRLQSLDGLIAIIIQPVIYPIMEKVGFQKGTYVGPFLCVISFLIFMIHSKIIIYFAMIILTCGSVIYNPAVSALVTKFSTKENRSNIFGLYNLYGIGSFVGPTLGSIVLTKYHSLYLIFIVFIFLLSSLFFVMVNRKIN